VTDVASWPRRFSSAAGGEVLTRADDLGGPTAAVAEFRAGERAVYGTGSGSAK
jgi:hypothetical protein